MMAPLTPTLLPRQGGGVAPLGWHYLVLSTARHLPLDGGGWEGVSATTEYESIPL